MSEHSETPPIDFNTALQHFRAANGMAAEIHDENEQAAFYQESVPDPKLHEIILSPLAEEQRTTVDAIRQFIKPNLYRHLALRHSELTEKLVQLQIEQQDILTDLDAQEKRLTEGADAAIQRASSNENVPTQQLFIFMEAVSNKKLEIQQSREDLLRGNSEVEEELASLERLFRIVQYPWAVPYANLYEIPGAPPIGDMADAHDANIKSYESGGIEPEEDTDKWDIFSQNVDRVIEELDAEGLLQQEEVVIGVISARSQSYTMGTVTALDRLHNAGLISKQKRGKLLMGPFEVVCNKLFNTNKEFLGKGPNQKRAIEIINERLTAFFAAKAVKSSD